MSETDLSDLDLMPETFDDGDEPPLGDDDWRNAGDPAAVLGLGDEIEAPPVVAELPAGPRPERQNGDTPRHDTARRSEPRRESSVRQAAAPDKMIPHNVEAERAVLGALLIDPDAHYKVSTFLRADDFYVARHQWLYEAIMALYNRGEAVDLVTLCDELERSGGGEQDAAGQGQRLIELGGAAYITGLINATPTALNVEHYGRIVERTSILRRLIGAAGEIAALAYQDTDNADETIDRAEQILFSVSQRHIARDLMPIREVVSAYYERVDYLFQHKGETIGVPTGYKQVDKLLGGLQKSDLIIVAARPGMGKTSLLLSFAHNAACKYNQRVAVFSLEMSSEQLVQRLIASETGIDSQRLRLGSLKEEEWPLFIQATGKLSETMIFIDDTPSISDVQLRTKARRLYAEHGLDLIVIDYLQLMQTDRRIDNRVQEISVLSRSLKGLARELNIPVIVASQLSRAVEQRNDKRPILSDLRESGSIEQDADIVIFIYRDDYYSPETDQQNIAEIIVSKHRNGPTGTVPLFFQKELTKFREVEIYHQDLEY